MTINDLLLNFVQDLPIDIDCIKKEFLDKKFDIELNESNFSFPADTGTINVTKYKLGNTTFMKFIYYTADLTYKKEFTYEGYIYMQKVLKAYFDNIMKGFEQKFEKIDNTLFDLI